MAEEFDVENCLRGNEKIREAAGIFRRTGTEEDLFELLETIRMRMHEGGGLLVPVDLLRDDPSRQAYAHFAGVDPQELQNDDSFTMLKVAMNGGHSALAAFTIPDAVAGPEKTLTVYPIERLIFEALDMPGVDGIVLDPWDKTNTFYFEASLIRLMLDVDQEAQMKGQ